MIYAVATLEPPIAEVYLIRSGAVRPTTPKALEDATARFGQCAEVLTRALSAEYLLGPSISAADMLIGAILDFAGSLQLLDGCPALADYTRRITSRPAYRQAMS
jgi:glutathione S-transferase